MFPNDFRLPGRHTDTPTQLNHAKKMEKLTEEKKWLMDEKEKRGCKHTASPRREEKLSDLVSLIAHKPKKVHPDHSVYSSSLKMVYERKSILRSPFVQPCDSEPFRIIIKMICRMFFLSLSFLFES